MKRVRGVLGLVIAPAALLPAGCGGDATPEAEQVDLAAMDEYSCGYGFWLGSADQTVAVRFAADNVSVVEGELPQQATLPNDAWDAMVLIGEELYANWCDDVLEPGEPEPTVNERWPISAGTITLHAPASADVCPHEASATATGLEATRPDGSTVELGERELVNDGWGCFAG
jgi:hypothetical protein